MNVKLPEALIRAIGQPKLTPYGVDEDDRRWAKSHDVYLPSYSKSAIEKLRDLAKPHEKVRGAKVLLHDCELWLKALASDGKKVKPRSVSQFESMLRLYLGDSGRRNAAEKRPIGPRLYRRDDERGVWLVYYVSRTYYTPERKERGSYSPPFASVVLHWKEFGGQHGKTITFGPDECLHMTVEEALARAGYVIETQELYDDYSQRRDLFHKWSEKIGKQFLATGVATDNCDGNPKGRDSSWYWRRTNTVQLDKTGEPARVVVDLFYEDDDSDKHSRHEHIDRLWWHTHHATQDEDEDDDADEAELDYDSIPEPVIPLHPLLAMFDMRRHLRLRIDVGQLKPYKYDDKLGDKLVLPKDNRSLVEMLLSHKGHFRDIVKGKSGGALILCAGLPGTGKTLTAEVYAEVMKRPLYTVQASQLGTNPDDLEDELLKTFARSTRWNAIMLLDEADVYVHTRGNDLQQNAIVGVFLRVLEYYKGVLFLTTNRADLVDDAIASRCVARITYKTPEPDDQRRIWKVLSETSGIEVKSKVIDEIVEAHPRLSGRDVKNLLKLAQLVSETKKVPITLDVIKFVKRFKPTMNQAKAKRRRR